MLVIGFFGGSPTAIGVGVALAGLGGLEVAIREHLAGYRSHTTLLAGGVFVVVVGAALLRRRADPGDQPRGRRRRLPVSFLVLRRAFQRASGGLSFKVGRRGRR